MNRNNLLRMFLAVSRRVSVWIVLALLNATQLHASGSYDIKVGIDPENLFMTGTADVIFDNNGKYPLDKFIVEYAGEGIAGRNRISLETIEGDPLELIPADAEPLHASRRFLVRLPQALTVGERLALRFSFDQIYRTSGLTQWWYPNIDPGYRTAYSFRVRLIAPVSGLLYWGTGALVARTQLGEGMEAIELESLPVPAYRLLALPSSDWNEIKKYAGDVQVSGFWKESHWEEWIKLVVDIACDVIEFYRNEFGFYPGRSLCIVPGGTESTGGYPIAPGIVAIHDLAQLGDDAPRFAKWIVAHEIGHQYWGEYVLHTTNKYTSSWLHIGLGIYMDRHYVAARNLGISWHQHHFYDSYLAAAQAGLNTTIRVGRGVKPEPGLNRGSVIIHGKGYAVVRMLEELMGPDNFRKAIDECLREFAHKAMSDDDFRQVCEKYAQRDLRWFFTDWVTTSKSLAYSVIDTVTSEQAGRHLVEVTLARSGEIRLPVPVRVTFEDGSHQTKWSDRKVDYPVLTFEGASPLKEVLINPDGVFAMIEKTARPRPEPVKLRSIEEIRALRAQQDLIDAIAAAMGGYTSDDCRKVVTFFDRALEENLGDARSWRLLGRALYDVKRYEDGIVAFQRAAETGRQFRGVALAWQGHLYDLLQKRSEALECYHAALRAGIAPAMYSNYRIVMSPEYVEQFLDTPYERKGH